MEQSLPWYWNVRSSISEWLANYEEVELEEEVRLLRCEVMFTPT